VQLLEYLRWPDNELVMKVKIVSKQVNFWRSSVSSDSLQEAALNEWFSSHKSAKVIEVKHDVATSLLSGSVLIVSIYYSDDAS
jgi:hypothetical protein